MHYSFEVTVTTTHTAAVPLEQSIKLAAGVLNEVEIYFDDGCDRNIRCQLWGNGQQILPTNPDGFYALDGDKVVAPLHYNLSEASNQLWLVCWSISGYINHVLTIHLSVKETDEVSTEDLVIKLTDVMASFIDVLKRIF